MPSRVASNNLNQKRRFERAFNNDVRKIYQKEARYVAKLMSKGLQATEFKHADELYEAVARHFKRIKKNVLRKNDWALRAYNTYQIAREEVVLNDLLGSFNKLSLSAKKKQEKEDFSTIAELMEFKQDDYSQIFVEQDSEEDEKNAEVWLGLMYASIPQRTLLISNVETQEMYEATKMTNAFSTDEDRTSPEMVGSAIAFGTYAVISSKKTKTWVSLLNSKTRSSHAMADGQTVNITEPFIVQGQELMYPGDGRHATPDNFMNCYCSVRYN